MRSPRMAPNTFVAPAGNWFKYSPTGPFRFCCLAVDGLMAPARNAVDSETQKEIVLQVGPKNRYFPLSSNAAGATFIIVAVQESGFGTKRTCQSCRSMSARRSCGQPAQNLTDEVETSHGGGEEVHPREARTHPEVMRRLLADRAA